MAYAPVEAILAATPHYRLRLAARPIGK